MGKREFHITCVCWLCLAAYLQPTKGGRRTFSKRQIASREGGQKQQQCIGILAKKRRCTPRGPGFFCRLAEGANALLFPHCCPVCRKGEGVYGITHGRSCRSEHGGRKKETMKRSWRAAERPIADRQGDFDRYGLQPNEKRNREADGTERMWHILWEDGKLTVDVGSA